MHKFTAFASGLLLLLVFDSLAKCRGADRPNFVWILSEDNSKHYLRPFDDSGAPAPNIERLASHGLVFEHAFSCSPVCSVARTTLMTGLYAPRVGTQFHRKIEPVNLPRGWRLFPAYLRKAGYYTSNNAKKDYNVMEGKGVWDESSRKASWRDRPAKETPFFHMQSFSASHESSLHFSESQMDVSELETRPEAVRLAPYHPDTELFRYTYARYHDRIGQVDDFVGRMTAQLEEDGVLEDTFIFYFGDHGGVLPRSKGYVYESGLHVPLVVRIPENWKHLAPWKPGRRVEGFVSFVDFGPTVLQLAGASMPDHFDGQAFLGEGVSPEEVEARDEAFGYADRFDEKYDLCRSLRKGRFKYIRNYQAFYPDSLQNNYRYKMLAYEQWRKLFHEGKLNAVQRRFFEPKDAEALYDLHVDPYETNNLADAREYADVLLDMRDRLARRVRRLPDLSFYPESSLVEQAMSDPFSFGGARAEEIVELADTADLCLLPFDKAQPKLEEALASANVWQRYWALIACSVFGEQATALADKARSLLADEEPLVRVRAAEFLGIIGEGDPRPTLYEVLRTSESSVATLLALNTVVFLRDFPPGYEFKITADAVRAKQDGVERRLEYLGR